MGMHAIFARIEGGSEPLRAGMMRTMYGTPDVGGASRPQWACQYRVRE